MNRSVPYSWFTAVSLYVFGVITGIQLLKRCPLIYVRLMLIYSELLSLQFRFRIFVSHVRFI